MVISLAPVPDLMFRSRLRAPVMSLELSNGEVSAASIALVARSSPEALPIPINATPESRITVSTSAKSTFI